MKKTLLISLLLLLSTGSSFATVEKLAPTPFSDIRYQNGCVTTTDFRYTLLNPPPSGLTYIFHVWSSDDPFIHVEGMTEAGTFQLNDFTVNINTMFSVSLYDSNGFVSGIWSQFFYKCPNDFDLDGVLNSNDECPHESGNAANFGCLGNPDFFTLDNSSIFAPGWSAELGDVNGGNRVPLARFDGFITITPLLIKNTGFSAPRRGSNIQFFISTDQTHSSDDFRFTANTLTTPHLEPLETSPSVGSQKLQTTLQGSTVGDNLPYGNYFLLIVIDPDNLLEGSEVNTANNTYVLPMTYTNYIDFQDTQDEKYLKIFYDEK